MNSMIYMYFFLNREYILVTAKYINNHGSSGGSLEERLEFVVSGSSLLVMR